MRKRVLILGGYGNFGGFITRRLAPEPDLQLIVAGRSGEKAERFAQEVVAASPIEAAEIDVDGDIAPALARLAPDIVIHTCGPFQGQSYRVAEACIEQGCHYVDLADARSFVANIVGLDAPARAAGVLVVSGASSVPTLSAAIVDSCLPRFQHLRSLDYGITAAQLAGPGPATVRGILSYVGRPFGILRGGEQVTTHGWQGLRRVRYPELGDRLFGDCDIPDLALFPARYPGLRDLRFGAGHEVALLHRGAWAAGWLVRWRLLPRLDRLAGPIQRAMSWFDFAGTDSSGLHMILAGQGLDGRPLTIRCFVEARRGHGPLIPCIPAILLARRLARGDIADRGAKPCLDLIDLDAYRRALEGLDISFSEDCSDA